MKQRRFKQRWERTNLRNGNVKLEKSKKGKYGEGQRSKTLSAECQIWKKKSVTDISGKLTNLLNGNLNNISILHDTWPIGERED